MKRGEILAVVGSSGAGKSTLVHLIPRFFDVTAGHVLIDGHDVRDVTLSSLRSQIGIVTQETVLFNDRFAITSPTASRRFRRRKLKLRLVPRWLTISSWRFRRVTIL